MNLPNKITMVRIILSFIMLIMLVFPFYAFNYEFPKYLIAGKVLVDSKYLIAGVIFLVAAITDALDGHIARKRNLVTNFGKTMDAIADKVLVNGLLIILAYDGFISVVVPVVIITRDIFVDSLKMVIATSSGSAVGASITGKIKTIFMMSGITLVLFYNLPFELISLRIADIFILIGTVMSVVSGVEYFVKNKEFISDK